MIILAFDTTSEHGGVAIYRDLERLGEAENQGNANYSVTLFEMTDRLLARLNLTLRDIDLFAVATGPGSFTGIRVGVAAAQGWAQAFERPVRGISVLEAMVEAARRETDWAVPLLDARRAEFYAAVFRRSPAEHPERLGDVRGAWGEAVALDTEGVAAAGRNAADRHIVTCAAARHADRRRTQKKTGQNGLEISYINAGDWDAERGREDNARTIRG